MAKGVRFNMTDLAKSKVGRTNASKLKALLPASKKPKESKYKNKKIIIDGIEFDSIKEGNRYRVLKDDERLGKIKNLRLQVPYLLTPKKAKTKDHPAVRAMHYKADFVYIDTSTGLEVVEDSKGMRTQDYINKSKMMLHIHNIRILET